MKKFLLLIAAVFLTFGLAACSGDTDQASSTGDDSTGTSESENKVEEQAEEESEENKSFGIGDTAEVDGVKFTLKSVTTTDERNEFADTEPTTVVKVEYEIENVSDEEIPVGGDLQAYDGTGNQVESYPLDNTMGSLQPGKKIQGVEHFGIEEGPIEIYFAPLVSFEDPAIFTADVQ